MNLVGDGRVEVGGEEEAEEVVERGQGRGAADEARDPAAGCREDAVRLGGVLPFVVPAQPPTSVVVVDKDRPVFSRTTEEDSALF